MYSAPSSSMRSQARIQFEIGPAQLIGVPPMSSRPPAYSTRSDGTNTTLSPAVWAGPRLISCTCVPPTSTVASVSKVRVAGGGGMPPNSDGGEDVAGEPAGRAVLLHQPEDQVGAVVAHLGRGRRRGDDFGVRDQLVAEPVVAVGVGVDHRTDRVPIGHRAQPGQHLPGHGQV